VTFVVVVLAVAAILGGCWLVISGLTGGLSDEPPDAADIGLPEGEMSAVDVEGLRFAMALRGYRMAEVDEALDRLARELRRRDNRIAVLEGREPEPEPVEIEELPAPDDVAEPDLAEPAEPEPADEDEPQTVPLAELFRDSRDRTPSWTWSPEPIADNLPPVGTGGAAPGPSEPPRRRSRPHHRSRTSLRRRWRRCPNPRHPGDRPSRKRCPRRRSPSPSRRRRTCPSRHRRLRRRHRRRSCPGPVTSRSCRVTPAPRRCRRAPPPETPRCPS
jgi:DivIVA domain-containing protein